MPLTGISRREPTELAAFSFRELLTQRRLAQRAIARGRNVAAAGALLGRIEAELDRRRAAKFRRAGEAPPL